MIPPEDLRVENGRPHQGGQHAGVDTSIKVTHLPTGTSATVSMSRSQHKNREIAIDMILSALTHPKA